MQKVLELLVGPRIRDAVKEGARQKKACELVGITSRTLQNWRKVGFEDKRKGVCKRILRKLDIKERKEILEVCNIRNKTMEKARLVNPERWGSRSVRQWISEDTVVLNPEKIMILPRFRQRRNLLELFK